MNKQEQIIWILHEIKKCEDLGEWQDIPELEKDLAELTGHDAEIQAEIEAEEKALDEMEAGICLCENDFEEDSELRRRMGF